MLLAKTEFKQYGIVYTVDTKLTALCVLNNDCDLVFTGGFHNDYLTDYYATGKMDDNLDGSETIGTVKKMFNVANVTVYAKHKEDVICNWETVIYKD